jgi:hypothetical protein
LYGPAKRRADRAAQQAASGDESHDNDQPATASLRDQEHGYCQAGPRKAGK